MLLRRDRAMTAIGLMLDIAFHGSRTSTVSATDIAGRIGAARRGLEPLLQALSRADLLESVRGPRGGYRLARAPRDITLADIAQAASSAETDPDADPAEASPSPLTTAVIDPLWTGLSDLVSQQLAAMTLDDLLRRAGQAGLCRPASEPITYVI